MFDSGALHLLCPPFSDRSVTKPGFIQQGLIVLIFIKQKLGHKQVSILAGSSHSQAFAQQLALLPLSSFYPALLRFSARLGYTRSAFHFFLFLSLFPSLLFFFLIKKIFIGALEK